MEHITKEEQMRMCETCSIRMAQKIIGGKWSLNILHLLSGGTKRFGELSKCMPMITQATLTKQLRVLEDAHLINRVVYPQVPPKVEYSLTEIGLKFLPVMKVLKEWAVEYKDFVEQLPEDQRNIQNSLADTLLSLDM